MISVQEACRRIVQSLRPLGAEVIGLREALGRVLAADVAARMTHPQANVSAMDGYAVRSCDVVRAPVTLRVVATSAAGHPSDGTVGPGETARIFTGAVIPAGADAIVLQEEAQTLPAAPAASEQAVIVRAPVTTGRHIRPAGLDFKTGEVLLRAGRRLTFRDIALAAAMNVPWLSVVRRPRIAILSTGDEVRLPGETIRPGDLIGSNGFALGAFVTDHGGEAIDLGVARDDRASLLALVQAARGADVLLTSGGVSVGEHDLVRTALDDAGLELDFWKVAVRPGKPLMHGSLAGVPVIGLPGNPVSALVGAVLFVLPVLNALLGRPLESGAERQRGILSCALPANDRREDYLRAAWHRAGDGAMHVTPFARQDSALQAILASADCLVVRLPHAPPAQEGDTVEVIPLP